MNPVLAEKLNTLLEQTELNNMEKGGAQSISEKEFIELMKEIENSGKGGVDKSAVETDDMQPPSAQSCQKSCTESKVKDGQVDNVKDGQTDAEPGDYKSALQNMTKDEIGQFRRDVRYSTSANGKFEDFLNSKTNEELAAAFGPHKAIPASQAPSAQAGANAGGHSNHGASASQSAEPLSTVRMPQSFSSAPGGDGQSLISLSMRDQAPGGKHIYDKKLNIGGNKLHETGLGRHSVADDGSEIFTVDTNRGFLSGVSKTPRVESAFTGSSEGKTFSATYQATDANFTSIFQHKGKSGGDQIQVYFKDGQIVAKDNDNNSHVLANVKEGEKFSLRATDNGSRTMVTIADASGRELGSKNLTNGGAGTFRYGAYTGLREQDAVQIQVWNAKVNGYR